MLTGDKYNLFRPVFNRPEKERDRERDRQEGAWGLEAEGLGDDGGGSYCRSERPWWEQCVQQCWSNFTACPPHLHSPTHFCSLSTCTPISSMSLFASFSSHHLSTSPSLSLPIPKRDQEDKNLQVALNSTAFFSCSGKSQEINKLFSTPSRRHLFCKGAKVWRGSVKGKRGSTGDRQVSQAWRTDSFPSDVIICLASCS